ncbi:MAG: DNA mismatch repair endonuclease MutL [Deltaproteobacteria bacterium]
MGKIRILPDDLVSKIAAGEIVERPASVVKELLENSLDARSSRIRIELKSGGRRLIQVSDDGEGMTRDDALYSLERHATSKIRSIEDLFSVKTLGFRGEALPSIASVSRFRLTTRARAEISGVRISVDGGSLRKVEEVGCPEGTAIEARDLFYNTPARLKFMRTGETELLNALDIIQREAAARPDVGFEVIHDERAVIRLAPREGIEDRLREIFLGTELFAAQGEAEGILVKGFLSSPDDERTTGQKLYCYVNRRAVKDRFLTRMAIEAYGKLIEKGRYPQGALFIETPDDEVDVNVHPTKSEVRFRRGKLVGDLIKSSIFETLRRAPWIKGYRERTVAAAEEFHERGAAFEGGFSKSAQFRDTATNRLEEGGQGPESGDTTSRLSPPHGDSRYAASQNAGDDIDTPPDLFAGKGYFSALEVIGQLGGLYIVASSPKGMILIDQHAAHERVNYERFKQSCLANQIASQELLIPLVMEFSPREVEIIRKHARQIESLGIRIEEFGGGSFAVRSHPAIIGADDIGSIIKNIIAEIDAFGEQASLSERIDHIAATMACHGSIRANMRLGEYEIKALLAELGRAEFPHFCPHGRPVAREITFQELERMFKRT